MSKESKVMTRSIDSSKIISDQFKFIRLKSPLKIFVLIYLGWVFNLFGHNTALAVFHHVQDASRKYNQLVTAGFDDPYRNVCVITPAYY